LGRESEERLSIKKRINYKEKVTWSKNKSQTQREVKPTNSTSQKRNPGHGVDWYPRAIPNRVGGRHISENGQLQKFDEQITTRKTKNWGESGRRLKNTKRG